MARERKSERKREEGEERERLAGALTDDGGSRWPSPMMEKKVVVYQRGNKRGSGEWFLSATLGAPIWAF